jgi:phosphoribosylamine---glycine ligase
MKVLVIDVYGVGVDYCLRAQWAGHDVKHYLAPGKRPNIGKGLTHRVESYEPWMRWADLIVCTASAKYGSVLEQYYAKGYPIFGANKAAAEWELDRCVGQQVLEDHGIKVLPYSRFSSYDDAIAYVHQSAGDFVCKPIGDADRALSYVGKGPDDLKAMMKRAKRVYGSAKQDFILQDKCKGIEFAVGGWFGPHGFNDVWEENFEHKKLFAHDIGMNTGEMGTAMKYVHKSKLAEMMLAPLEPALKAIKFCGNIDVSVMIDDKGIPWPLEFTMRMGWPAFYLNQHLHKGDPVNWMYDLVHGKDSLKVSYDHCIGVCVVGPSFPHCHVPHEEVDGIPIFGISESNIENVHLCEIMAGEHEVYEGGSWQSRDLFSTAGEWPLVIVGTGASVALAKSEAYKVVGDIKMPNSPSYRHDIGDRCEKNIKDLKAMGYAKEWVF